MNDNLRKTLPTPSGWLVAPARNFCLLFFHDPKSAIEFPIIFTQLWYCTKDGIPTKLKNIRRQDYQSSYETWTELVNNGWELVEHQFNACVDAA
tara:strand:+ start:459 stop:740 length:282 start_codon:yes stop_codon:yes gene_type:complete